MFRKIVVELDRERGGEGSGIVSLFWGGGYCFAPRGF